ncbi:LTA synthase family protein [uncultured Ruthenibacterium sp.]|uniref:LTA synthase family protein n=1 Tax=uncultured Ruthenibacterium sp. TaxID=1905347 RepID=UPI00349E659D
MNLYKKWGNRFASAHWRSVVSGLFVFAYVLWDEFIVSVGLGLGWTVSKVLFALSGGAFLYVIGTLFSKTKTAYRLQSVCCMGISMIYLSQSLYWCIFKTPYYLKSISGLGKAVEFSQVALKAAAENVPLILGFLTQILILFTWYRRWMLSSVRPLMRAPAALAGVWLCACALCISLADTKGAVSPRAQLLNGFVPAASVKTFGFLPTMLLDVKYNCLGLNNQLDRPQIPTSVEVLDPEPQEEEKNESQVVQEQKKNILDIDFETPETNAVLRDMNAFFSSRTPTSQNDYTGLFKGKNLILLTCEGFSEALIDEERTPTLYKLFTEGFRFHHFYTPIWGVSTSDGEFVATTGLLPKTGVWSYTEIADNAMPFALGNQFGEEGICAFAFHGHDYTYYNRDKSYPAMGYVYYGQGGGLNLTNQWPESDVEMIEQSFPFYAQKNRFHVYYMTISGHLGYTFNGNSMASKHAKEVETLSYGEEVKAYLACQLELENALKLLLEKLDESGQLNNTVIALSADHYPYGLTNEQYAQLRGKENLEETFELYENAFLLWTPGMEPVDVDTYCSSLDILPTLSNLFGLPYDSRLMMGTDIFSDTAPMVLFADHSFITDRFQYDAKTGQITSHSKETVSQEEIESAIWEMEQRFLYSAKIIQEDYYGYLLESGRMT